MVSVVAWFVGAVLLALPFLRRRVAPRSVGYLLCVSALWMPLGNFVIAPSGPAANVLLNLLSNLGPVWLLAALAALGWRLWAGSNEPGRAELGWSHDHRSPGSVRRHA